MFILKQNTKPQKKKTIESSDWIRIKSTTQNIKESYEIIRDNKRYDIFDFDDHLNDPKVDYLNQNMFDKSKNI